MNILLHICCGPCLIYPLSRLKNQGFKISGFYYNPNLYPESEYYRRVAGLKVLAQEFSLQVEYPKHQAADFYQAIDNSGPISQRCLSCWSLRLRKTALEAKQNGFKAFSTTLLVSPYQNHSLLKQLGDQISQELGIDFHYEDFRPGFRQAQLEAQRLGIYRQKYCGCQYSQSPKARAAVGLAEAG